jgi:GT2 family glycosyltransferase
MTAERTDRPSDMHPVTTVVMTRNRWRDLSTSLPHHQRPVMVVDNGSEDGSAQLVAEHFPDVTVVPLGRNLGAVARNVGVERARTPYVAFADDDSWWEAGALQRAVHHFETSPRLGLLAARVLVGEANTLDPVSTAMARSPLGLEPDLPGPSVLGFLACGTVVRRRAFLEAGGFDEVVQMYGEEERLAWDLRDAGWGLAYLHDVVAHHHPSSTPRSPGTAARLHRNRVLTAVMRRPWPSVVRTLIGCLGSAEGRAGVRRAVPRLRDAMARRRVLTPRVEAEIRRLEHAAAGCSWETL